MKNAVRIGLIGDYNPQVRAHRAIPKALELAGELAVTKVGQSSRLPNLGARPSGPPPAKVAGFQVRLDWIHTASLDDALERRLSGYDGLWCVPASPYANMEGALRAIRFAREEKRPFLGTCGGFQHAVIEYARNVLGMADADHAESNPAAALPLISPLACSLVGTQGKIRLEPGSRIARIYVGTEAVEEYHCNFGVNPLFEPLFESGGLRVTGWDENGETRVVELEGHPFFIATLFQPELSALDGKGHPLILAFVQAAAAS